MRNTSFTPKHVDKVEAFQLPAAGEDVPEEFLEWTHKVALQFSSERDEALAIYHRDGRTTIAQPGDWIVRISERPLKFESMPDHAFATKYRSSETPGAADALGKLRHVYSNLVNGGVRDTASAKRIGEGLLSPAIAELEGALSAPASVAGAPSETVAKMKHNPIYPDEDREEQVRHARYVDGWNACHAAIVQAFAAPSEAAPSAGTLTNEQLADAAYKGFDDYWVEDCPGREREAWLASAKAVLALAAPTSPAPSAASAQPMFYASSEQANALQDRHDDSEGGVYLPLRKTAAGKFTMPLYAAPTQQAALVDAPSAVGTASMYAQKRGLAVTTEWMCGWNACLDAIDVERAKVTQPTGPQS